MAWKCHNWVMVFIRWNLIQPYSHPDWREVRQDCRSSSLRWLLQSDVIIITRTVHKERMQENLNLFDFELDAEDMQAIANLDTAHSLFLDHHSGETTKQFMEWRAVVKPTE